MKNALGLSPRSTLHGQGAKIPVAGRLQGAPADAENPKGACPMLQRLDLPAGYALKVLPASGQPCGLQANLQPINQK